MYKVKTFSIPDLIGISSKNIEEHLKLYEGYVKHTNLILQKITEIDYDESHLYEVAELQRRFSFEFDGMKNHELFFSSFEGGFQNLKDESSLKQAIIKEWGTFENWLKSFKILAKTRGVGWAILYYDKSADKLLNAWIDEQHLGHLMGAKPILALDMWEHSFVSDYFPSGKAQYIEDFFANLNWTVIEGSYNQAIN
jgi:Fe-Mn family superoxide dismutase